MTNFAPDDIVDIVRRIEGAKVTEADGDYIDVMWPGRTVSEEINITDPTYTITSRAPKPKSGEVWRWNSRVVHIVQDPFDDNELWTISPDNRRDSVPIDSIDWTGATRLFPSSSNEDSE